MQNHGNITSKQAWHRTPEARALLADCIANPPAIFTRRLESHERWSVNDQYVTGFNRDDDRVDALILIETRACDAAMRACGDDREALRRLIHNWPHTDHVIAAAIESDDQKAAA